MYDVWITLTLTVMYVYSYSMGGAIAVHAAIRHLVPSLIGLIVIDVVEGKCAVK